MKFDTNYSFAIELKVSFRMKCVSAREFRLFKINMCLSMGVICYVIVRKKRK